MHMLHPCGAPLCRAMRKVLEDKARENSSRKCQTLDQCMQECKELSKMPIRDPTLRRANNFRECQMWA